MIRWDRGEYESDPFFEVLSSISSMNKLENDITSVGVGNRTSPHAHPPHLSKRE